LQEIEEIIDMLGSTNPSSSRYASLELEILKSIMGEQKE